MGMKGVAMERSYIYGLVDPRSGLVMYVGRSKDPAKRRWQHIHEARAKVKRGAKLSRIAAWINDVEQSELEPQIVILDDVPQQEAEDAEAQWIRHYLELNQAQANGERGVNKVGGYRIPYTETPNPSVTPEVIKAFRLERGWSQRELSAFLGITAGLVSHWETGTRNMPRHMIRRIEAEFGPLT